MLRPFLVLRFLLMLSVSPLTRFTGFSGHLFGGFDVFSGGCFSVNVLSDLLPVFLPFWVARGWSRSALSEFGGGFSARLAPSILNDSTAF